MTDFNELLRDASRNLEAKRAQELSDARTKRLNEQAERARKQPLIESGNVQYTETVSQVINVLRQAGIREDRELYHKNTKCWTIHPLEDARRPFFGMKIVSPENTIWQRHYHNGVSYTDRALRVVDLTEYPAKSPIMVSQTGANLYYNPQTSGLYLSDRFLDVDYYVQPQIDIVEWLARATAAKVRGLI